jgi:ribonuclease Y
MYNENFIKGGAPVMTLQEIIIVLAIAFVCILVTAVVTYKVTVAQMKKSAANTIGNAEEQAREIIDDALKAAETKKRESLLEIKEESIRTKNELDKEIKERRAEVQRDERRVQQKEANIDKKSDAIERREQSLAAREESLNKMKDEVSRLNEQRLQELERISGLTSEQAKDYLLKIVEDEVKHETAVMIKEMESQAKEEADKKAKEYVVSAIQRCAADHVSETTISVVQLPSDEMKGRIIGREGRNIRTLETMTGVDLIIDDTPEAVILSGFDPIRREVARIALEKLIVDGRIHPARIEEMVEKAQKEVEVMIKEEGEAATLEVGVHGIHPELVRLLGKMKFRTSYGQNALKHSVEVAQLSGLLAAELGLDVRLAKRAGLLHDIGKAVDHEMEGSHVQLGAELCRKYKENAVVVNAVESHHGDVEATSLIACIVQAADTISAARPGARRETLETYTSRLRQLEDITNNFKGVEKSYAIQAGREVRVMVVPEQMPIWYCWLVISPSRLRLRWSIRDRLRSM